MVRSFKRPPQSKPFVIPIFIPHAGCRHRCVFCDQTRTTGQSEPLPAADRLHATIAQFLNYRSNPRRFTEIAFYGGNFLGMAPEQIVTLLEVGSAYVFRGMVQGLRFSTRPDTIAPETLGLIGAFPVTTIELGVQSMNDQVLELCRRGHTAQHTRQAVGLLRTRTYRLGLQMMVGLPGDSPERTRATGKEIAALKPDFVRIYPTLVLSGSPLAGWHAQGRYSPLSLEEAVDLVKDLLTGFMTNKIPVIRMGLQPTADLNTGAGIAAGPFHPAFGELVHAALWRDAMGRWLSAWHTNRHPLVITAHPSLLSRVKGHANGNINWIAREFNPVRIAVHADHTLPTDRVLVNGGTCFLLS